MRILKTFLLSILLLAGYSAVYADTTATIEVCPLCIHKTVTSALGVANNGDTILINKAIHQEANIVVNKNVTIMGGTADAILRAASSPNSGVGRVMSIEAGRTVTVRDLTLQNGDTAADGGGIFNEGTLTLQDVRFENNSAERGGGLAMSSGSRLTGNRIVFSENSAVRGGALSNIGGTGTISNTSVTTNTATLGGGFYQNFGNFTVEDSTIRGNQASSNGGAGDFNGGHVTVSGSLVRDNSADFGGGFSVASGNLFISDATQLIYNNALYQGGGIYGNPYARVSILQDSEISYNETSSGSGGGIYHTGYSLLVSAATVASNSVGGANSRGAGIYIYNGGSTVIAFSSIGGNVATNGAGGVYFGGDSAEDSLEIVYSLLLLNSAGTNKEGANFLQDTPGHADIVNSTLSSGIGASQLNLLDGTATLTHATVYNGIGGEGVRRDGGTLTLQNSIVAGHAFGAECIGTITVPASVPNLANDNSCGASIIDSDAGLEPLADNGGDTQTHIPAADSPAVDAASAAVCNLEIVNGADQRFYIRPYGSACDLGAVERNIGGTPTAVGLTAFKVQPLTWLPILMVVILTFVTLAWRDGDWLGQAQNGSDRRGKEVVARVETVGVRCQDRPISAQAHPTC